LPPGFAVAADRNPWIDSPSVKAADFSGFRPEIAPFNGTSEQAKRGNTLRHEGEGQNVLFLDCHVDFEKRPYCGLDDDNIYTSWDGQDRTRGVPPKLGSVPADARDSLLVNDPVDGSK
jgi:prepilin-type processing-associated H-X9-DG protein